MYGIYKNTELYRQEYIVLGCISTEIHIDLTRASYCIVNVHRRLRDAKARDIDSIPTVSNANIHITQ